MLLYLAHFAALISNVIYIYISIHKQFIVSEVAVIFSFGFAREGVRSYFFISSVLAGHMTLYCSQHVACEI